MDLQSCSGADEGSISNRKKKLAGDGRKGKANVKQKKIFHSLFSIKTIFYLLLKSLNHFYKSCVNHCSGSPSRHACYTQETLLLIH